MNLGDRFAILMIVVGVVLSVHFGDWRPFAVCALVGVIVGILASAEGASSRGRKVREGQLVRQATVIRCNMYGDPKPARVTHVCGAECRHQGWRHGTQLHEQMEAYVRADQDEQDSSGNM